MRLHLRNSPLPKLVRVCTQAVTYTLHLVARAQVPVSNRKWALWAAPLPVWTLLTIAVQLPGLYIIAILVQPPVVSCNTEGLLTLTPLTVLLTVIFGPLTARWKGQRPMYITLTNLTSPLPNVLRREGLL